MVLWELTIFTGWWFQTFFIFHNIWDNHSHWLSYFLRWLKPPTSLYIMLIILIMLCGVFPSHRGTPKSSIFFGEIFHYKLSSYWGTFMTMETLIFLISSSFMMWRLFIVCCRKWGLGFFPSTRWTPLRPSDLETPLFSKAAVRAASLICSYNIH